MAFLDDLMNSMIAQPQPQNVTIPAAQGNGVSAAPFQVQTQPVQGPRNIGNVLSDFFSAESMAKRRPLANALGTIGDALSALHGGPAFHHDYMQQQNAEQQRQQAWDQAQQDRQRQEQARGDLGGIIAQNNPQIAQYAQLDPQGAQAYLQQQQESRKPYVFGNTIVPRNPDGTPNMEQAKTFTMPYTMTSAGDQPGIVNRETGGFTAVGDPKKPALHFVTTNGVTQALDPTTGQPVGKPITLGGGAGTNGGLTEQALNTFADLALRNGGKVPAGYARNKDAMVAITNRIAQRAAEQGYTPGDLMVANGTVQANNAALKQVQQRSSILNTYKQTALQNGKLVEDAAATGAAGSGMPLINAWQQAYRNGVQGSPDVARFGLAVNTFANEYAKVVSGATGSQAVTVHASQEMLKHLSTASTPQQVSAVIQQAQKEMESSTNAFGNQVSSLQNALRKGTKFPVPSAGAINYLRQNPKTAAQFDATFGPGKAAALFGSH